MDLTEAEATLFDKPNIHNQSTTAALRKKWSSLLILIGIAATFGTSIPVGYNIGVINAPAEYMRQWCNETMIIRHNIWLSTGELKLLWASIVSIFLIGGAVGSLMGSLLADKIGRKGAFASSGILFVISAFFFYFCRMFNSVEMLLIGRLLVGLASGLTTSTVPMYLTELAPLNQRGTMGVLCSMGVTGGVVVGQIMSLQELCGTEDLWHYALTLYVVLVVISFIPYPYFPESPKYLYIVANRQEDAIKELKKLRFGSSPNEIYEEIQSMASAIRSQVQKRSIISVLKDPKLLLPLFLVCSLQGGQQLSGINAVFYYSVSIFESSGLNAIDAKWANLGAGCINLLTACFSPILMSKVNRRPLVILSCAVSAIFLFILSFVVHYIKAFNWLPYACIISVFGYILFYQIGLGPIPYFIGSEIFEVSSRSAGNSIGSLSSWTCNFIVGISFLSLQEITGAFVFLPFSIVCVLLSILLYRYLPESRGKDSSDIAPLVANGFKSIVPR